MKTSVMAQLLVSAGPSFFPGGRTGFRIGGEARRPRVNRRPARRNGSEVQRPRRFGQRGAAVFRPTGSNRRGERIRSRGTVESCYRTTGRAQSTDRKAGGRSEERRVGKECVRTGRTGGSP